MKRTVEPSGESAATWSAPASVAPPVIPQKIPSRRASSRNSRSASAPLTPTIRSTWPAASAWPSASE